MATTSRMVGTGVTAETVRLRAETDLTQDDFEQLRRDLLEMPERLNRPWGTKASLIAALRSELVQIKADAPPLTADTERSAYFASYETRAWFVLTAIKLANHVEQCVKADRVWEAVSFAFDIGKLIAELGFKLDWEEAALEGQAMREGRAKGAHASRRHTTEHRYGVVKELIRGGLSPTKAFAEAAKVLGDKGPSSARDAYYKLRTKPSKADGLE